MNIKTGNILSKSEACNIIKLILEEIIVMTSNTSSSTPLVKGRKPIRLRLNTSDERQYRNDENSSTEEEDFTSLRRSTPTEVEDSSSSQITSDASTPNKAKIDPCDINGPKSKAFIATCLSIIFVAIAALGLYMECPLMSLKKQGSNTDTLNMLKTNFPSQDEDIWHSINSGILDINGRNKPAVFMFTYNKDTKGVADDFIYKLGVFAVKNLTDAKFDKPIVLDENELNSKELQNDYGVLISKYKSELEKTHVMVVKDLQNVPGTVARAFHSYCDEITPLVGKSLFLFSIDVTNMQGTDFNIVEKVLKIKWKNLQEDEFGPLITRITSMIFKINLENNNPFKQEM